MSHDRLPEGRSGRDARQDDLVAQCIDGEPSEECLADLADVLRNSAASREALVGHLLLDTLLREELGGESLSALVDIMATGEQATTIRADAPPAADGTAEFVSPRDVRVATRGDQFYVEMNRKDRHWFWGRDAAGAIWMTVGRKQAIVVEKDEQGAPLRHIGNLYALNLETLLRTFRTFCSLTQSTTSAGTHRIDVTPRSALIRGGLRHATIEVDRETKAVRRLVLEREFLEFGRSTVSFTLVETRPAVEGKYGAIGHLEEPARIVDRTTSPDGRRELLVKWFGSQANSWIRGTEETRNAH